MQQYQLKRPISNGAMGLVFEGRKLTPLDPTDMRPVAVKVIPPRDLALKEEHARKLFRREAVLSWQITHEHQNLVTTYDYGITDRDYRYLVMEYVDGVTLHQLIQDEERLPYPVIRRIAIDVLCALVHMHNRDRQIHRDISARNVLVGRDGVVKLADFGLIKTAFQSGSQFFRGTVPYAGPEAHGGASPTPAADLYSLGALLYQLVTGEYPYGKVPDVNRDNILKPRPLPPLPDDVPPDLSEVILGLVAWLPTHRRWVLAADVLWQFDKRENLEVATEKDIAKVVEMRTPREELDSEPALLPNLGWPSAEMSPPVARNEPEPEPEPEPRRRFVRWLPWMLLPVAFAAGLAVFAFALDREPAPTLRASTEPAPPVVLQPTHRTRRRQTRPSRFPRRSRRQFHRRPVSMTMGSEPPRQNAWKPTATVEEGQRHASSDVTDASSRIYSDL